MLKTISGNSKVVRNINRSMILNVIRNKQPISRTKIAKLTGLNKSTVSSIVVGLIREELIYEHPNVDLNIGRNPIDLSLKLGTHLIGAINIDSYLTRFAIVDIDGSILGSSFIETASQNAEKFIERCLDEIKQLCTKLKVKHLEGLGVSVAGIVDSKKCIVNFAPNLGWQNVDVGSTVRKVFPDVKILALSNDAKASALAELWFGTHGINLSNFVFLSVGTGIGSGIVVEGKILDGEFHASGEVGHITIFEEGEMCICGNRGCWERYASDRATVRRYLERTSNKTIQTPKLLVDDIIQNANSGDNVAMDILVETGYFLGLGIANIVKAIDPHAIIIGGRIIQAWDIIYPEINKVIGKRAFYGKKKNLIILPTSLKTRPRLLGAGAFAIKEIFDGYKIMF